MFRTLLNQQLGFYNCDDKTIKINFYTRTYNEAFDKLNFNSADYINNLTTCERALEALYELGIPDMDRARHLLEEYNKILVEPTYEKLVPDYHKKLLHLKFHYLKATQNPDMAFDLLGNQDSVELCYFTEEQMLDLDKIIEHDYSIRLDAVTYITKYYLRLAITNPKILENYAAYLCRCASTPSGKEVASKLNSFMRGTLSLPDCTFPDGLFPGWRICSRRNLLYLYKENVCMPLGNFIAILIQNETVFAYWDFKRQLEYTFEPKEKAESLLNKLTTCLDHLIHDKPPLSTLTFDLLKKIVLWEEGPLKIRAQLALDACKRAQAAPFDAPMPALHYTPQLGRT